MAGGGRKKMFNLPTYPSFLLLYIFLLTYSFCKGEWEDLYSEKSSSKTSFLVNKQHLIPVMPVLLFLVKLDI